MPTEVNNFVTCPRCGHYCPRNGPHTCSSLAAETFPRGPSNEQTLLTELGEVKAQRDALAVTAERMSAERDDWKARCEAAEAEATQLSGLKIALRLREALVNCVDYLPAHLPAVQAARAILKETAP